MQTDEQQIRQLVATWMSASKAGDNETVMGLMTDDVVFLVPGRTPMIGKAAFAAASQAQSTQGPPKIEGHSEIQELQVLGNWAFMRTQLEVTITPAGGTPITRSGHTLTILKKENEKWLLARDANLLAPKNRENK